MRLPFRQAAVPCLAATVTLTLLLTSGCAVDPEASVYSRPNDEAVQFEKSAGRPPTAKTLYALARILAIQGRDAECAALLRRVIQEQPGFLPARQELAELMLRQHETDAAIEVINEALRLAPNDSVLLNNLGVCYLLKQDYPLALDQFMQAAAFAPKDARYRANMALALGMMGRYAESLGFYVQAVPPAQAHYNLGVVCQARGDPARAAQEFTRARALDPGLKIVPRSVAAPPRKPAG